MVTVRGDDEAQALELREEKHQDGEWNYERAWGRRANSR